MKDAVPSDAQHASHPVESFTDWLRSPPGRYLVAWEQAQLDRSLADVFGYHALQVGMPELRALRANRMPHRWLAMEAGHGSAHAAGDPASADDVEAGRTMTGVDNDPGGDAGHQASVLVDAMALRRRVDVHCQFDALPFASQSLDLVVLPHTLELAPDPHEMLREVDRVLMPNGRLVVCGFNSTSLWGMRQRAGVLRQRLGGTAPTYLPQGGEVIGHRRLRDWLRLLSIDVEGGRFGCYAPALRSEGWLLRTRWMDKTGDRWWPVFGAVYFVVAVKRVRGMRMVGLAKSSPALNPTAPVVATRRMPKRQGTELP